MSAVVIINPAAIAVGNPQDITADVTKFDFAKSQVTLVVETLTPLFTISTDGELDSALIILKQANEVKKAIEEKRKSLVKPFNEGCDKINGYAKDLTLNLSTGIEKVKTAVLTYQKDREEKALAARANVREDQLLQLGFSFNANRWDLKNVGGCSPMEIKTYEEKTWSGLIESFVTTINHNKDKELQQLSEEKDLTEAFGSDDDKQQLNNAMAAVAPIQSIMSHFAAPSAPSKVKGQTKTWSFEITNANAVPREYLMVDETLIREAIRNGVRDIRGVSIFQKDGLSIR